MKAEIGIDDRRQPYITLRPKSSTEFELLKHVSPQLGIRCDPCSGEGRIGTPDVWSRDAGDREVASWRSA